MSAAVVRLFSGFALLGLAAAVWFAGPMVAYDGLRPLADPWLRGGLIGAAVVLAAGWTGARFRERRRRERKLAAALAPPADAADPEGLGARMAEALAAFKARNPRRDPLRTLPWYVLIGPRGAGKTTALLHSGLSLPSLPQGGLSGPAHGVGATQNCDWWFAEEAVLVDTAGRYTLHRPDQPGDRDGWFSFLALLRRTRPRQPLNGAVVAFSLEDLVLLDDAALDAHVAAIRARLGEIGRELKVEIPLYVLFTKADLIDGFASVFDGLDEAERRQVWGATAAAATPDKAAPLDVGAEFDSLAAQLSDLAAERLGGETDLKARRAIFAFPQQFAQLKGRLERFVRGVAGSAAGEVAPVLRGFYLSSGTREGLPIDQLASPPRRSAAASRGPGREGFFLGDLLGKLILAEARWVARGSTAVQRAKLWRAGGLAAVALATVAATGALTWSFLANRALVRDLAAHIETGKGEAGKLLGAEKVADADLENVVATLAMLRSLPTGYETRAGTPAFWEGFGLGQRGRLRSATETAYRQALERLFRARLILQLERAIEAGMRDPAAIYEPLKIYLMLEGQAPQADDALIVAWFRQDWERNRYPGAVNREGREQLEKHLRAMLALDDAQAPLFQPDRRLVEAAQRSLARLDLAQLASALIASAIPAAGLEAVTAATLAGADAAAVFGTADGSDLDAPEIPGLYSADAFQKFFLPQLAELGQRLADDQWVLGAGGEQVAVETQLRALGPKLVDGYGREFLASWNGFLERLRLKPMAAEAPSYPALAAAASTDSPLRRLVEGVASQTSLAAGMEGDAERLEEGLERIGLSMLPGKGQNRAGAAPSGAAGGVPGAAVEAQFKPYRLLVEGEAGQRPVDVLVRNLSDILQSLVLAANSPAQAERVAANLQLQIANLRTNASRFPRPLNRMIQAAAGDFEGSAARASVAELSDRLEREVAEPCRTALAGAYPFERGAERDLALADFARLFAPGGTLDRFFAQNLSPLADTSGAEWRWKDGGALARKLPADTLRSFQQAARIRDAFFPPDASQPSLTVTLTPLSLHGDVDMALLEIGGQIVQSYQSGSVPATVTWPEGASAGAITLNLTPEIPGRPSNASFTGPWALMRLLDTGTVSASGDAAQARVVIGGRDVTYALKVSAAVNPFLPPALSDFRCPAGL